MTKKYINNTVVNIFEKLHKIEERFCFVFEFFCDDVMIQLIYVLFCKRLLVFSNAQTEYNLVRYRKYTYVIP